MIKSNLFKVAEENERGDSFPSCLVWMPCEKDGPPSGLQEAVNLCGASAPAWPNHHEPSWGPCLLSQQERPGEFDCFPFSFVSAPDSRVCRWRVMSWNNQGQLRLGNWDTARRSFLTLQSRVGGEIILSWCYEMCTVKIWPSLYNPGLMFFWALFSSLSRIYPGKKNLKRKYRYVCLFITESLCCASETNIVNQLPFNKKIF